MRYIENFWNNFKSKSDVWFFYGFILTFTLSVRKVLFFYPIQGSFNEYTGIYLYLSDIFLFLTISTWIILVILYNNISYLSIYRFFLHKQVYIPLILVIWCLISILWSNNTFIALFRSIKVLELYLLYLYLYYKMSHSFIYENVPRGTFIKNIILLIILIGFIQALFGLFQFSIQHSIGLGFLWESFVSRGTIGVAKIILDGKPYIRAYGLFPHPNILGGFLLMTIILTLLYKKLLQQFKSEIVPRGTILFYWDRVILPKLINLSLVIQIISLILTFSKSSLIGLLLALIYPFLKQENASNLLYRIKLFSNYIANCSTWNNSNKILKNYAHKPEQSYFYWSKTFIKRLLLITLILIFLLIVLKPDFYSFLIKPLNERLLFQNVSRGTILDNPIFGVGIGQFIINMPRYANQNLELWQYQPVHNIFLLIWSELGIIGLSLFLWLLWMMMFHSSKIVPPQYKCSTWNNLRGRRGTFCGSGVEYYEESELDNQQYEVRNLENKKLDREENGIEIVPRGTIYNLLEWNKCQIYLKSALIGFIFIMLFDHYLWDIQQGQIILWITLGLLASER